MKNLLVMIGAVLLAASASWADAAFVPDDASANRCRFIADENGDIILAFRKGFMLIGK